jgi:hypothetical protein
MNLIGRIATVRGRKFLVGVVGAVLFALFALAPLPVSAAQPLHLGAASCASGVCHGHSSAVPGSRVALNEYDIWLHQDSHSRAYRMLDDPLGRSIAAKLGLASATSAKICLDCHADNVPRAQQGPKFDLTDGVTCEQCHGAAEHWLQSHSQKGISHASNVALGMYASEQPTNRARLCLGCHAGNADRFATHEIMGAGHPRLYFELERFTSDQPPHFHDHDPQYIARKGRIDVVNLWVSGQLMDLEQQMLLVQARWGRPGTAYPELALYDCQACHHPLKNQRWQRERVGPGVRPGSLRLQTGNFVTLRAISETLEGVPQADVFMQALQTLVIAGQTDAAHVHSASDALTAWARAREVWTRRSYSREEIERLRKALLSLAAENRASDFSAAEQVAMGVDSLSYALNDQDRHSSSLDRLFGALKSDATYDPDSFVRVAAAVSRDF